jgi:hypothetical protein
MAVGRGGAGRAALISVEVDGTRCNVYLTFVCLFVCCIYLLLSPFLFCGDFLRRSQVNNN